MDFLGFILPNWLMFRWQEFVQKYFPFVENGTKCTSLPIYGCNMQNDKVMKRIHENDMAFFSLQFSMYSTMPDALTWRQIYLMLWNGIKYAWPNTEQSTKGNAILLLNFNVRFSRIRWKYSQGLTFLFNLYFSKLLAKMLIIVRATKKKKWFYSENIKKFLSKNSRISLWADWNHWWFGFSRVLVVANVGEEFFDLRCCCCYFVRIVPFCPAWSVVIFVLACKQIQIKTKYHVFLNSFALYNENIWILSVLVWVNAGDES